MLSPVSALKQLNSLFIIIISARRDTHSLIHSISTNCVSGTAPDARNMTKKKNPKQNKMVKTSATLSIRLDF